MRIAMFTEVFLPKIDGVVTRVLRTLDELSAMGHDVLVFAPGSPPPVYAGFDIVKVRSVGFRPWYPEIKVGLPTPKIAEQMIAFRPEVVHAVNPAWLAAYGVLSAKRRDIPLLASYHTQLASYTKDLHLSWLAGTADRWTTTLHNRAEVNLCTSPQMVASDRRRGHRRRLVAQGRRHRDVPSGRAYQADAPQIDRQPSRHAAGDLCRPAVERKESGRSVAGGTPNAGCPVRFRGVRTGQRVPGKRILWYKYGLHRLSARP